MSILDLVIENFLAFLVGAGAALAPFTLEKLYRLYIIINYRKIRTDLGILYSECTIGTIRYTEMDLHIQTAFKLSQLDKWEQVERILTQIIHTARIQHEHMLLKTLGKERTEFWTQKWLQSQGYEEKITH